MQLTQTIQLENLLTYLLNVHFFEDFPHLILGQILGLIACGRRCRQCRLSASLSDDLPHIFVEEMSHDRKHLLNDQQVRLLVQSRIKLQIEGRLLSWTLQEQLILVCLKQTHHVCYEGIRFAIEANPGGQFVSTTPHHILFNDFFLDRLRAQIQLMTNLFLQFLRQNRLISVLFIQGLQKVIIVGIVRGILHLEVFQDGQQTLLATLFQLSCRLVD